MSTSQRRCFVISPIGDAGTAVRKAADAVFRFVILPAMEAVKEFDILTYRSDHLSEPGSISEQMFREILQADLCIAVVSGYNPNVFYELAVAQAAGRPVIVLAEEGQRLPFDIKDLRAIAYDLWSEAFFEQAYAREVASHIRAIAEKGWSAASLFQLYPFGPKLYTDADLEAEVRQRAETAHPRPLPSGRDRAYRLPGDGEQRVVILTGDIDGVRGVDVVVSSENTDLQMARYYDPSISGMLRYLDADRGPDGHVLADNLNEALQRAVRELDLRLPVRAGAVIPTETSRLRGRGIRYVFHLAAVEGSPGEGYRPAVETLGTPVANAFERFTELAEKHGLASLLFPVLGAGTARRAPLEAVRELLGAILAQMGRHPACRTAYVLAWKESHRDALRRVAAELGLAEAVDG